MGESSRHRLVTDVLHADPDPVVGRNLGDAAPHRPGAEHGHAGDRLRPASFRPGRLARLLAQLEDEQEVLALGRSDQIARRPGLAFQTRGDRTAQSTAGDLEDAQRRGVVATRSLAHLFGRGPQDQRSPGGRAVQEAAGQGAATPLAGRREPLSPSNASYQLQAPLLELPPRQNPVDESDAQRLGDPRGLAREHQVESGRQPHQARQARRAAPRRKDPEQNLGQTDSGAVPVVGDPVVTRKRQFGAAAEADPADRRDGRNGKCRDPAEECLPLPSGLRAFARIVDRGDCVDVGPGDERTRLSRPEQEGAKGAIRRGRLRVGDHALQSPHNLEGQDILAPVGIIEGRQADATGIDLEQQPIAVATGRRLRARIHPGSPPKEVRRSGPGQKMGLRSAFSALRRSTNGSSRVIATGTFQ